MPIIGFNFDIIKAERYKGLEGKIEIKNNLGVTDLVLDKVSLSSSEEVIKFLFEYTITYGTDVGEISLKGHVLYLENKEQVTKIMEEWKAEKKVPSKLMQTIINHVLVKCTIKALNLENDIGVPPHISLPRVKSAN